MVAKHHFQVKANILFVVTLFISIQKPLWGVHTCTCLVFESWDLQAPLELEIYQILEARGALSTIGHKLTNNLLTER